MRVVVLHNEVSEHSTIDARDVIVQRRAVVDALHRLGHETSCLSCDLDLHRLRSQLVDAGPDVVFNLVESLSGSDLLMAAPTLLLDAMSIPYTGCGTEAIYITTHKVLAKKWLRKRGIATPGWFSRDWAGSLAPPMTGERCDAPDRTGGRFILKHVWEHASVGMCDDAMVDVASIDELSQLLERREAATGRPHFAERFVDGREFNMALLATTATDASSPSNGFDRRNSRRIAEPQVLPPSEIEFNNYPTDKPRIVGYQAKWEESSFEYVNTPRRFNFSESDRPLLSELSRLAVRCWHEFGLQGYARVDFRVDEHDQPWVLEVNANPCISPDGGFASSLAQAVIPFETGIARILDDALARRKPPTTALQAC
jgi:D-alanine-D-alanine ligase